MMIGTHYPSWKRTIRYGSGAPRLWPWVLGGLAMVVLFWMGVHP